MTGVYKSIAIPDTATLAAQPALLHTAVNFDRPSPLADFVIPLNGGITGELAVHITQQKSSSVLSPAQQRHTFANWNELLEKQDFQEISRQLTRIVAQHPLTKSSSKVMGASSTDKRHSAQEDLSQDLFLLLHSKERFTHYLTTGMSDRQIETEISQIELTNLHTADLRKRYPESYRIARRISTIIQTEPEFAEFIEGKKIPGAPRVKETENSPPKDDTPYISGKLGSRMFGLNKWHASKATADIYTAEEKIASVDYRLRNNQLVGCTGDADIIIFNDELQDLIREVLSAVNNTLSMKAIRSLVMSRLAICDVAWSGVTLCNPDGEDYEVSYADSGLNPEEYFSKHVDTKEAALSVNSFLTDLKESVNGKPKQWIRMLNVLNEYYLKSGDDNQLVVAERLGVSDSLVSMDRMKIIECVQKLKFSELYEGQNFVGTLRKEVRKILARHANAKDIKLSASDLMSRYHGRPADVKKQIFSALSKYYRKDILPPTSSGEELRITYKGEKLTLKSVRQSSEFVWTYASGNKYSLEQTCGVIAKNSLKIAGSIGMSFAITNLEKYFSFSPAKGLGVAKVFHEINSKLPDPLTLNLRGGTKIRLEIGNHTLLFHRTRLGEALKLSWDLDVRSIPTFCRITGVTPTAFSVDLLLEKHSELFKSSRSLGKFITGLSPQYSSMTAPKELEATRARSSNGCLLTRPTIHEGYWGSKKELKDAVMEKLAEIFGDDVLDPRNFKGDILESTEHGVRLEKLKYGRLGCQEKWYYSDRNSKSLGKLCGLLSREDLKLSDVPSVRFSGKGLAHCIPKTDRNSALLEPIMEQLPDPMDWRSTASLTFEFRIKNQKFVLTRSESAGALYWHMKDSDLPRFIAALELSVVKQAGVNLINKYPSQYKTRESVRNLFFPASTSS